MANSPNKSVDLGPPAPWGASWPAIGYRWSYHATVSCPLVAALGGFSAPQGVSMKKRLLEMEREALVTT